MAKARGSSIAKCKRHLWVWICGEHQEPEERWGPPSEWEWCRKCGALQEFCRKYPEGFPRGKRIRKIILETREVGWVPPKEVELDETVDDCEEED